MAAIFAQMRGDAVSTCLNRKERGAHGIRPRAYPGVAKRCDVIDVYPETQRRNGHRDSREKIELAVDALHPRHHGFGTQLGDDTAEMLQVIDLEIDRELGEVRRATEHADVIDIAVVLGDDGGNLGEASGLVDVVNEDPRWEALRGGFVDIPAYVEPALRLLLEILQSR